MADTAGRRAAKARAESAGTSRRGGARGFWRLRPHLVGRHQGRTSRGFTEGSRAGYRESLELYAIPYFEARRLKPHQIQRRHVKAFIGWLGGDADRSRAHGRRSDYVVPRRPHVVKHLAPIKAMFADAVEDDELPVNPASVRVNVASTTRSRGRGEKRAFTDEQLAAVLTPRWTRTDCCSTRSPRPARAGAKCASGAARTLRRPDGPVLRVRRAYSTSRATKGKARRDRQAAEVDRAGATSRSTPRSPGASGGCSAGPTSCCSPRRRRATRLPEHLQAGAAPTLKRPRRSSGRRHLGWLAHVPAHRRLASVRRRPERQAGPGMARPHKATFTLDTYVHLMGGGIGGPLLPPGGNGGQTGTPKQADTSPGGESSESVDLQA